jgi:predicted dehydrogenase
MEKTFTETADQARALKALAEEKNTHILVDYTFTFSKGVAFMLQLAAQGVIGQVRSASLSMRQYGRFSGESVYPLLGSHMLSLLHKLFPLGELEFQRQDQFTREEIVETGELKFRIPSGAFCGSIALSLNFPGKERKFVIFGEKGALMYDMLADPPLTMGLYRQNTLSPIAGLPDFNEGNNLAFVIDHFYKMLMGRASSNIGTALAVTACLENVLQGRSL